MRRFRILSREVPAAGSDGLMDAMFPGYRGKRGAAFAARHAEDAQLYLDGSVKPGFQA